MPFFPVDGGRLYYETHGSGPALIFAHGLGGNHLSWWQQVPAFREHYTCVVFAHRGFWPSEEEPGGPGPAAFADDLTALIDYLGLAEVRLVAQSMGGWSCLGYALREPARVRALVMAATTGTYAPTKPAPAAAAAEAAALWDQGIHPAAGARMAREQPARHFLYRSIDALASDLDKEAIRTTLAALRTTPAAAVAALAAPVLCITGEEDIVIPPDAVAELTALIPGARLARVPAAGHSVYFERPAVFNRLMGVFLATVDPETDAER